MNFKTNGMTKTEMCKLACISKTNHNKPLDKVVLLQRYGINKIFVDRREKAFAKIKNHKFRIVRKSFGKIHAHFSASWLKSRNFTAVFKSGKLQF